MQNEKIPALAAKHTADLVAFCQKAVQTRSYSDQEGDMVYHWVGCRARLIYLDPRKFEYRFEVSVIPLSSIVWIFEKDSK